MALKRSIILLVPRLSPSMRNKRRPRRRRASRWPRTAHDRRSRFRHERRRRGECLVARGGKQNVCGELIFSRTIERFGNTGSRQRPYFPAVIERPSRLQQIPVLIHKISIEFEDFLGLDNLIIARNKRE